MTSQIQDIVQGRTYPLLSCVVTSLPSAYLAVIRVLNIPNLHFLPCLAVKGDRVLVTLQLRESIGNDKMKHQILGGKIALFLFFVFSGLILNPPAQIKLQTNTLGFFIAESAKDVKR